MIKRCADLVREEFNSDVLLHLSSSSAVKCTEINDPTLSPLNSFINDFAEEDEIKTASKDIINVTPSFGSKCASKGIIIFIFCDWQQKGMQSH